MRFGIFFLFILIVGVSFATSASFWVNDPTNCPATNATNFAGQDCSPNNICGDSSGIAQCFDTSTLSAPSTNSTTSSNVDDGSFDGGFLLNCFATADSTSPFCDNSGNFNCDRNSTIYSTLFRQTICLENLFGVTAQGDCRSGYNDCDADGGVCEILTGASCSLSTGTYNACNGLLGNCTSSTNSDCNDDDGDSNLLTCNGANGCEVAGGGSCGNSTGTYANSECLGSVGNCTSAGTNLDCNDDDSDSDELTCNGGSDGCEVVNNSACSVGVLAGTYEGCSSLVGNCVVSKSYFETGTETAYSTSDALLWGTQYGSGALMNFTNANTNETFLVNGSGCIIFPDNTTQCTGTLSTNFSGVAFYNQENNFTANQTFSENITVVNYGFFGWLGSITNFITGFFIQDINLNGTITGNGSINISGNIETSGNLTVDTDTLFVDSDNDNVGIGTMNPNSTLEVDAGTGEVVTADFHAGTTSSIRTRSDSGKTLQLLAGLNGAAISASSGSFISFATNSDNDLSFPSNERMRIDSSGNVGIGTTNPTQKLDVNGSVNIAENLTVNTNTLFVDSNNDRVGIGTSSPTKKLHISGASDTVAARIETTDTLTTDLAALRFKTGVSPNIWQWFARDGDFFSGIHGVSDYFTIKADGKVGIGTSSPTQKLDVNGSVNVSGVYYGNGSGLTDIGAGSLSEGSINTTHILDGTILTEDLANGSVTNSKIVVDAVNTTQIIDGAIIADDLAANSINTTHIVNGTIIDADISDTTNLTLGQRIVFALGGFIQNIVSGRVDVNGTLNVTGGLNVDSGSLFVNETSDRVGIGTTTPDYALDVNGSIKSTETYLFYDGSTQSQGVTQSGFDWHVGSASFEQSFNVSTQTSILQKVFFKPDGLKMYISEIDGSAEVFEFNLSTPWDVSSAVVVQSSGSINEGIGLFFRSDGLKMYTSGSSTVREFDLTTAWDVSTVSSLQTFSTTSENSGNRDIFFKPDGLTFYVVARTGDHEINEYTLTAAWNISTANFSQVFSLSDSPNGAFFKSDGTRMYIISQGASDKLKEYVLSTPWNISTAVLDQTLDLSSSGILSQGVFFKSDATKFYTVDQSTSLINEFNLGFIIEGNTGIGTISPTQKLDVNGSVNITGNLYSPTIYDVSSQGLILAMNFNNHSINEDRVLDSSIKNNHGINNGATYNPTGGFNEGGAYEFDGVDDYILLDNASQGSIGNETSISFWVKEAATAAHGYIASENVSGTGFAIEDARFFVFTSATGMDLVYTAITDTDWHFMVYLFNGTAGFVYRDNVLIASGGSATGTLSTSTEKIMIGHTKLSGDGDLYLNGTIDEVKIYDRILSTDEIARLYLQRVETPDSYVSQRDVYVDSSGNVGIGTTSPLALLNSLGTSEQLRLSYNATEFASFTVGSDGELNIEPTGGVGATFVPQITTTGQIRSTSALSGRDAGLYVRSINPQISLQETDASANEQIWSILSEAGLFKIGAYNEASNLRSDAIIIDRTLNVIDSVSFPNGDVSITNNLTVGQRIVFALGGFIQNIVSGRVDVNGTLNVTDNLTVGGDLNVSGNAYITGNLSVDNDTFFVDSDNNRVGIGTTTPSGKFTVFAIANDPYGISTATFVQNFSVGVVTTTGLAFTNDGTKMFVVSAGTDNVSEFNLSTAFNISTAIFVQDFDIFGEDAAPRGLDFNSDGTKMYFPGNQGDRVYEYNLTDAYNISSANFTQSFDFKNNGNLENVPLGIDFSRDGTKMFVEGNTNDGIDEFNLSSAFDISSAVYVQTYVVSSETNTPRGLRFIPDGTKMFVGATDRCDILVYDLSSAYNVSSAVFAQSLDISVEGCSPAGIDFNLDGSAMFYLTLGGIVTEYFLGGNLLSLQDDGDLSVDVDTLFVDSEHDKVGIGTSNPNQELEVIGDVNITRALSVNGTFFVEPFNGTVSIGTNISTQTLDVNGSVNISGVYYGDGSGLTGIESLVVDSVNTTHILDETITDADINDSINLTLGQRIVFALGGFIQNIISGRVDINGTLNVTDNLLIGGDVNISGNTNIEGGLTVANNIDITNGSLFQPVYASDDGLILYLPFSEPNGSTQYDRSPHGTDGTQSGDTICNSTLGKYGSGCFFDGVDDSIEISKNRSEIGIGDEYTVTAWVKSDIITAWYTAVGDWSGLGNTMHFGIDDTDVFSNYVFLDTGTFSVLGTSTVQADRWYFIASTMKINDSITMYVDGILENSISLLGSTSYNSSSGTTFVIGNRGDGSNDWNGSIDEVMIYSRVLSKDEIRTNYLRGQGSGASGTIIADKFRIVDTSGEVNFIVNDNNVGIGTTSPSQKLEVNGSANVTEGLTVRGNVTIEGNTVLGGSVINEDSPLKLVTTVTSGNSDIIQRWAWTSDEINWGLRLEQQFATSPSRIQYNWIMRDGDTTDIDVLSFSQGNVGIGTITPSSKLEVNGSLNITGDLIVGGDLNLTRNTNIDGNLTLGQKITFALGGFIQNIIGGRVDVNGTLNVTNNLIVEGNLTVDNDTFFVDSDNNRVGIGTTSPTNPLSVAGTVDLTGSILIADKKWIGASDKSARIDFDRNLNGNTTDVSPVISILDSNLGVRNPNAVYSLDVAGDIRTGRDILQTTGGTFAGAVNYSIGTSPISVSIGDVNNDGYADLVSTGTDSDNVFVFINDGDGTFAAKLNYPTGASPISVSIGDVNNDGYADLAVANQVSASVSVFINNGDGTFAGAVNYSTGASPFSVAIGDLNNDGYADLAVANQGSNTTSVFINNGDGTFAGAVNYTTGTSPFSVAIGDLNNDGYADLAVANQGSDNVSVFINNGDGTFATKVDYTAEGEPYSVSIGDVNNDGYADLVVSNTISNTVSVFINNGDGTFATRVDYTTGLIPRVVSIGDLNNDGYADLAVANYDSNTVSIFINDGDGTFATKVDYGTGPKPRSVSIGDVNNDGYSDLAVSNEISNDVSVFINEDSTLFIVDKSSNRVGIGTASPTTTLDVRGNTTIVGDLNVTGTSYLGDVILSSDNITVNNILPKDGGVVNVEGNLTLGQKIVFALGGFIQNIVSGRVDVNGSLNVTDGLNVDSGTLFVDSANNSVGIGTVTPLEKLHIEDGTFLQTPGNPTIVGSISGGMANARQVDVVGEYAYVTASSSDSLTIIDITDPTNPTIEGSLSDGTLLGGARGLFVAGKYAYVANEGRNSLAVVDVTDPSSPVFKGEVTGITSPFEVYVSGRYAYVTASTSNTLHVIDISDPTNPTKVGSVTNSTFMNFIWSVYVQGSFAYTTSFTSDSIAVIDITDPTNPVVVGGLSNDTNMNAGEGVYVSGKYAYVTGYLSDSLTIINISDPSNPTFVGTVSSEGSMNGASGVKVSGKYAYVSALLSNSIAIVDISDPSSPTIVGSVGGMSGAHGIDISGKYVYVPSFSAGSLTVLDISGIDSHAASIGTIATSKIDVSDNAQIGNDLYVGNGLMVGSGGIFSDGSVSFDNDTLSSGNGTVTVNGDLNVSNDFILGGDLNLTGNLTVAENIDITNGSLFQPIYGSDDGLVLHASFSEGTGTTTYDKSPYTNDGTLINSPTWTDGKYGNALSFNASAIEYVLYPSSISDTIGDNITVEAWVYSNDLSETSGYRAIISERFIGDDNVEFTIFLDGVNHNLNAGFYDGIWRQYADPDPFPLNEWVHVAATYDGNYIRVYRDGIEVVSSAALGLSLPSGTQGWNIGRRHDGASPAQNWNGTIDEAKIYNRALSREEIRTQYLRGSEDSGYFVSDTFRIFNTSWDETFRVDSVGNVNVTGDLNLTGNINIDGNLTLGQRLIFALGGFIQNIISGRVDVNGTLNVSGGLNVDSGTLFVNETNDRVGIGTTTPTQALDVNGSVKVADTYVFSDGATQTIPGDPNSNSWFLSSASLKQSFNVSSIESLLTAVFFKPDGLRMYVVGFANDNVTQYHLSTAWDISTAVINQSFNVGTKEANTFGLFFRQDGKKMYIVGNGDIGVNEYDLTTAWDVSTASHKQLKSVSSENTNPAGQINFRPDGLKMYVTANTGVDDELLEYTLSTAWDISTANFTQQFNLTNNPTGTFFKPDGTRMYSVGTEASNTIIEYILSTPWDVSTATSSGETFIVSSQETQPIAIFFKPDGTKMYISGLTSDNVHEYDLGFIVEEGKVGIGIKIPTQKLDVNGSVKTSDTYIFSDGSTQLYGSTPDGTGWYVTTASFKQNFSVSSEDSVPRDVFFKHDGKKMYVVGDNSNAVFEYNLSTAWDVSTSVINQNFSVADQETVPLGVFFRQDGLKMYVAGNQDGEINEYDLTTAWDVSTAAFNQVLDVSGENAAQHNVIFKPDGRKMYIIGNNPAGVTEYDLSIPWDISTSSVSKLFSVSNEETLPSGMTFKPDGTRMYVSGSSGDEINEYDLSTPWDVNTSVATRVFSVLDEEGAVNGLYINPDGTKMYITGAGDDEVNEYDLGLVIEGNVGIGTTSPTAKLHISNGGNFSEAFGFADELVIEKDADAGITILSGNESRGWVVFGDTDESGRGSFSYDHPTESLILNVNGADRMVINNLGRVGIGTLSPSHELNVIEDANITGSLIIDENTLFVNAANNRVGIGTGSPTHELNVIGDANITGDLILGGDLNLTGGLNITGDLYSSTIYDVSSQGLILAMNFNNHSINGDIVLDSSIRNNHGTNNGATHNATGGFNDGGAYEFDGVNDFIILENASQGNIGNKTSISFWVKEASTGSLGYISNENDNVAGFSIEDDRFFVFMSGINMDLSYTAIDDVNWHHMVYIFDGNQGFIYRDNSLLTSGGSATGAPTTSTEKLRIGFTNLTLGIARYMNGTIDNVQIYDRVLSTDEIGRLYLQRVETRDSYVSQRDVYVSSSGNVGIGTSLPTQALEVNGSLNITGDLYSSTIYDVSSQGLILAMNFNNHSINGDIVLDSSIRNNHGTNNGATHNATGGFNDGGAYEFDGVDDFIILENATQGNIGNDTSISFWVKEAATAVHGYIASENVSGTGFAIEDVRFTIFMSGTNMDLSYTGISDTDWHHMVYLFNGTHGTIYRDNVLLTSGDSATGTPITSTEEITIGFTSLSGGSNRYMNGTIDEVKIYDRVLSEDEIGRLYLQRAEVGDSYVSGRDVYVDSNGNVGIGTSNPLAPLHINSTSNETVLRLQDVDGTCLQNPEAGSLTTSCSSDEKLKKDIRNATSALEDFEDIEVKDYVVKASGANATGVIAQEINETHPELVHEENGELFVEQPNPWKLLKAIQELRAMIESLVGGNYSFAPTNVINKDSVGAVTVLINETSVRVEFAEEYATEPIITVTPIGLPNYFYGVDSINLSGFDIVISEAQDKNIVFNWHAFAQELREGVNVTINGTTNFTENFTEGNFTINETYEMNITLPENSNETQEENDSVLINETQLINETVSINETTTEDNLTNNNKSNNGNENKSNNRNGSENGSSLDNKKGGGDNSSSQYNGTTVIEEYVEEEIVEEVVVEEESQAPTGGSLITGAATGVNREGGSGIFSKLFGVIMHLIGGGDE